MFKTVFRQPAKLIAFILLTALSVFLMAVGAQVFLSAYGTMEYISDNFVTVGTVERQPDGYNTIEYTSDYDDSYQTVDVPVFGKELTAEDFNGLPYMLDEVFMRPTLFAHSFRTKTDTQLYTDESSQTVKYGQWLISFKPLVDIVSGSGIDPAGKNNIEITNVFYGPDFDDNGNELVGLQVVYSDYSDVSESEAQVYEAGKEYISFVDFDPYFGFRHVAIAHSEEYAGTVEYSDDFFETDIGKSFSKAAEMVSIFDDNTFVVVPTRSMAELSNFSYSEATITVGRAISEEEFSSGAKVCLVPETLIKDPEDSDYKNNVYIGDEIDISVFGKSEGGAAFEYKPAYTTQRFFPLMEKPDEMNTVTDTYTIVGAYFCKGESFDAMQMADEEIIIPYSQDYDVFNLGDGIMRSSTTSFTLENGRINDFMTAFETSGINAEVSFSDQGYTEMVGRLSSVITIGLIMLVSGVLSFGCVVAFFLVVQTGTRRKETGIRISLGESRKKVCLFLVGISMFVMIIGSAAGSVTAYFSSNTVANAVYSNAEEMGYDSGYSDVSVTGGDGSFSVEFLPSVPVFAAVFGFALLSSLAASWIVSVRLCSAKPMELVAKGGE